MKNFSENLKEQRTRRKWSQDKLARKAGLTRSTISNYERGQTTPTPEILIKLALSLNMGVKELLGTSYADPPTRQEREKEKPKPKEPRAPMLYTPIRRLREVHNLTQQDLADLLQVPRATVQKWERQTLPISDKYAVIIEALFGTSLTQVPAEQDPWTIIMQMILQHRIPKRKVFMFALKYLGR